MKQNAKTLIKGILLILVFTFTFNLAFNQENYNNYKLSSPITFAQDSSDDDLLDNAFSEGDVITVSEILAKEPKESKETRDIIQKIAGWAPILHMIFHPLINFLSFQIGNFLGTDYIYEGAMGEMIKSIWVVSRNIVNIIFVLILLFLALRQIFDIKGEGVDLKNYLIKFTLLLIAVNFSWLATKVVLDAANVATNIVFSIPMGVSRTDISFNYEPCEITDNKTSGQCFPTAFWFPYDISIEEKGSINYLAEKDCDRDKINKEYNDAYFVVTAEDAETAMDFREKGQLIEDPTNQYHGKSTVCWDNLNLIKYDRNTSTAYLTYGMARIQNIIRASAGKSHIQLGIGVLMSLIIQAIYVITLLALFIALIIRMAILWLFVAFSPFLILMIFSEKLKMGGEQTTPQSFIKWAFVPVKVGAVFTVAFLMLSAGQAVGHFVAGGDISNRIIKFDSLFVGMGSVNEFIWLVMVIAVLWMGVFSVLKDMPIVGSITGVIQGLGNRAGSFMAKSPAYANIIPIYDHKEQKWKKVAPITFDPSRAARKWINKKEYGEKTGDQITQLEDKIRHMQLSPADLSKIKSGPVNLDVLNRIANNTGKTIEEIHAMGQAAVTTAFSLNPNIGADDAKKIWDAINTHRTEPQAKPTA